MALTDLECRNAKAGAKPFKLADGESMYLHILPSGGKKFRLKYDFLGKEKTFTIGAYPLVTLQEARDRRTEAKKLLEVGKDPSEERKLCKIKLLNDYDNTFERIGREWHSERVHIWDNRYSAFILKRMETYLFPNLGSRPISQITPKEVLRTVRIAESGNMNELAHRLMQYCSQIFRYGVATGRVGSDITTDLKGALKPVVSKSHPRLTEKELPEFLQKLAEFDIRYSGSKIVRLGLQLLILIFVRNGELRKGKWDEVDFEKAEWRIPPERMKMKEPHIVPLSAQSLRLLREIRSISGNNYAGLIFPNQNDPTKPMSENTFAKAIKALGYKGKVVPHGFRSTASTILNENGFNKDHIERQLAHAEYDEVRAAYNYAEYLPFRVEMMQWWANHIEKKYSERLDAGQEQSLARLFAPAITGGTLSIRQSFVPIQPFQAFRLEY